MLWDDMGEIFANIKLLANYMSFLKLLSICQTVVQYIVLMLVCQFIFHFLLQEELSE